MSISEDLKQKLIAVAKEDYDGDDCEDFKVIEEGEWIDDGKYSSCETIIKHKQEYYNVYQARSGSYFTDYEYDDPEVYKVVPKEVVKTVWKVVK